MSRPSKTSRVPCRSAITVSRRSSSVSTVSSSSARSSDSWPSRIGRLLRTKRSRARRRTASASSAGSSGGSSPSIVSRKASSPLLRVELCARFVDPAAHVDADGDVQRVGAGRQRLVEPAARQVHRVAGAQRHVEHRLAGRAERGAVALVLQRQLQHGLVDEPALLARHLQRDHLVRVVVNGKSLRAARRVVGVRLRGVAEERFQLPAVAGERQPVVVQALEDDRRARLELGEHAAHVGDAGEGRRPPGQVGRVARDRRARLDEAERGRPDRRSR